LDQGPRAVVNGPGGLLFPGDRRGWSCGSGLGRHSPERLFSVGWGADLTLLGRTGLTGGRLKGPTLRPGFGGPWSPGAEGSRTRLFDNTEDLDSKRFSSRGR